MPVTNPKPLHPGVVLKTYLNDMEITQERFAEMAGLLQKDVSLIITGKRRVTPDIALKLERALNNRAEMWNSIQAAYDMHEARVKANQFFPEASDRATAVDTT